MVIGLGLFLALTGNAQPVITNQPVNQTVFLGGNTTFSVMATGVGPLTYQWLLNGTNLPNNIITTVAGGNLFNNLQATNSFLGVPSGAAFDSSGNLFIADTVNNVIRKVATNGVTTIVAGSGSYTYAGDGGPATNASLANPSAVAVDTNGNLFILDTWNNYIRKVDTNGIITTYAGIGMAYQGFSGDGGQATNARINLPQGGLAVDTSGNLFFADTYNSRIRKINASGIISTVAGGGGSLGDGSAATSAKLNNPTWVAIDTAGNLYIADTANFRIRKVNASGIISTIAGNGTQGYSGDGGNANTAKINQANGVSVDSKGNVFIADIGSHCIRKITNSIITTVAGNGTNGFSGDGGFATNAYLAYPSSTVSDSAGNLFVVDSANNRIRKITNGIISTVVGQAVANNIQATNAALDVPWGLAIDQQGNLFITDYYNNVVRKMDANGMLSIVAGNGIPAFSGDGGAATNASLNRPNGVSVDLAGNLFISDYQNQRIRKIDTNGIITTVAGTGIAGYSADNVAATNSKLNRPYGVAVDGLGNLFVADRFNNRVRKIDTNGIITTYAGNGHSSLGSPDYNVAATSTAVSPYSVCLDATGNLYIGDSNTSIRKVGTNGIITTIANQPANFGFSDDGYYAYFASLSFAFGMAVDSTGNLFISDLSNNRIRKIGTNGIINTIAGQSVQGFSGDNGSANLATFSAPYGITLDAAGNLCFADSGNNRIRKLAYMDYADKPTFTVSNLAVSSASNQYSVIVTSASGSVTSSVVAVNVQLPPITPAFTASNGLYQFTWGAVSNQTYQLQCATNLAAPIWLDLGSPITATSNSVFTTDAIGTNSLRFYRVRLWP